MKKVLVSLLSIALIGCSQPILNNTSQYSDLDKEYSQFKTEALTQSYLKKKMDKWLSDGKYSKNLVREIEYAKFKHKDLLKNIVALQPTIFDDITANTAVTTKRIESPFENYIEYIDPYPSAVTANSATNITTSSFTAHWTSNTKSTSYKLFVNGSEVYSGANTSFDISNLSFGSTPTYYVKAINSAGTSPNSNTILVTLNPDTVTALDATDLTQTSFTANWSSLNGASSYKLKVDNGAFTDVGNITSSSITGLTIGSSHTYSVQAVNAGGTGSSSNIITVNLNPAVPSIPTTLAATNIAQTSFTANWNSVANASSYKLKIDSGSFVDVGAITSSNVTGLTAGSSHNYYVEASNISGTSLGSTGRAVTLIPPAPVAITATNITNNSFTAKWNASNGASSYKLFIDGVEAYTGSNLSYSKTGLSLSSLHSYYVQAINSSGTSSDSNTIDVTLLGFMTITAVQTIPTSGARYWKHFKIGTNDYIAVATHTDDYSYVAKWNTTTSQFEFFQGLLLGTGVLKLDSFTIGTDTYLALANYKTNSYVYKWNSSTNQFDYFQTIPTVAVHLKFITIGTENYLVAANQSANSTLYKWNTSTKLFDTTPLQSFPSSQAYHADFITIGTENYLVLGNNSIYKWNTSTKLFNTTPYQSLNNSSMCCKFFTINSNTYLILSSDTTVIYKWNSNTKLFDTTPYQTVPFGTVDSQFFTIGVDNYLALSVQWNGSYVTNSKIYKWNSSTNLFEDSQSILTYGAFNIEYFSIGIKNYLAVANCYNGSTYNLNSFIYRLD